MQTKTYTYTYFTNTDWPKFENEKTRSFLSGMRRIQGCSYTAGRHLDWSCQPKQQAHPMQSQHMCALWLSNSQTVLHRFIKRGDQDVHCRAIQRGGDLKAIWVPVTRCMWWVLFGVLCSHQQQWTRSTYSHMNGSSKPRAAWKKNV